jgi:hypothetical protein
LPHGPRKASTGLLGAITAATAARPARY